MPSETGMTKDFQAKKQRPKLSKGCCHADETSRAHVLKEVFIKNVAVEGSAI